VTYDRSIDRPSAREQFIDIFHLARVLSFVLSFVPFSRGPISDTKKEFRRATSASATSATSQQEVRSPVLTRVSTQQEFRRSNNQDSHDGQQSTSAIDPDFDIPSHVRQQIPTVI
jgi:hypothetical protein